MADKKVSALAAITNLSKDDLFMVVDDPAGTPASKKVTVGNVFGNVAVATTHKSLVTFTANTNHTGTTATFSSNVVVTGIATTPTLIVSTKSSDPATSNATTETVTAGTIFYSNTYLYIATDSNTIKRVALSTF